MALEDIIKSLNAHKPTLDSEEMSSDIKVNMSSPRQVRRSNILDGKEKFGDNKSIFRIPRWPRGLYEVCSKSLWKLATWKILSNKNQLNEEETKKLRDFEIYLNRPPSDDANRTRYTRVKGDDRYTPSPKISKKREHANLSSTTRFADNPRKRERVHSSLRSPKTSRHLNDDRLVRRRVVYESTDDSSTDSNYDAQEHNGAVISRRSRRTEDDVDDPAAHRFLMGGALRR